MRTSDVDVDVDVDDDLDCRAEQKLSQSHVTPVTFSSAYSAPVVTLNE